MTNRQGRRPHDWTAPGPRPAGSQGRVELEPSADEELVALSGDWRLFQQRGGHKWTMDDLLTAWLAERHAPAGGARRHLDLGCGTGSVLLMLAWARADLAGLGLELQPARAALARRSTAWNGVEGRCRIMDGDLRDASVLPPEARFDLVTGTPPYFPSGTATEPKREHAARCRFELHGGVEDYLQAGARWLAPGGRFVLCAASLQQARLTSAAAALGLGLVEQLEVVPREGKGALITLEAFAWRAAEAPRRSSLVLRDVTGKRTPAFEAIRARFGFPPPAPTAL